MAPREPQPQSSPAAGPSSSQSLPSFADTFPGYSRPTASATAGERERSELPPIQVMDPPPRLNGRKRSHNDEQASPPSPQVKDEIDELDESASSAPQGKRRRVTVSGSQRPEAAPMPTPARTTLPISDARRGSLPGVGSMRSPAPVPARLPPVPSAHSSAANPNRGSAALPAPSISFTSRRLGAGAKGKKPADILISPRDVAPPPAIMSAPPAVTEHSRPPVPPALFPPPHHHHPPPHSQQQPSHLHGPATPGVAIPSIPSIGAPPPRRAPAAVPPTPGRLPMRGTLVTPSTAAFHIPERGGDRSHLSVPNVGISGALASPRVPPTPGVLRSLSHGANPGPSSAKLPANREKERDAFLSPFAGFYDTLRDAAELKAFLAASIARADRAAASIDDTVERRVRERVAPIEQELDAYKRRVDALEEEMRALRASSAPAEALRPKEGYTFPSESRSSQSPEVKGKEREKTHEQGSKSPPSEEPRASAGP
ncbi:unnamed protein product [Peniophora sp. CBMAI 1063]|nr:unnamed protein product [Peniophora sp. CBMAI 1063]